MDTSSTFLFDLTSHGSSTARTTHIRRLCDLLKLCAERGDVVRAHRAWCILIRCKEFDWKAMWELGLMVLSASQDAQTARGPAREAFLRTMMLQFPDEKEALLKELILQLAANKKYQDALNELELYLPSFPYQENPVLHCYSGLLALQLSSVSERDDTAEGTALNDNLLRKSKASFERALILDPENVLATELLATIRRKEARKGEDRTSPHHEQDQSDIDTNMDDGFERANREKFSKRVRSG